MIIRAADFSDFPVNTSPFVKYLNDYVANLENSAIPPNLMTGQLDAIRQSKNMYVFQHIRPIFLTLLSVQKTAVIFTIFLIKYI